MIRLSIIIPFYNVEKYISACLDSVFNQDIPEEEYEVICVNDGSPDGSRDIVCSYLPLHPNLRLIDHPCNMKLGAARNTGRKAARGNYIWQVDSDDMIAPNCLKHILEVCEENDLDVLNFGVYEFSGTEITSPKIHVPETIGVVSSADYLEKLDSYQVSRFCSVWQRVVKREFLDSNNLYSPEINMGEDIPHSFHILLLAKRFMMCHNRYYYYRKNPDALTGKNWIPTADKLYEKSIVDATFIFDVVGRVSPLYKNLKESYKKSAIYTLEHLVRYYGCMTKEEQYKLRLLCRKNLIRDYDVYLYLSKQKKILFLLWLLGLYKF